MFSTIYSTFCTRYLTDQVLTTDQTKAAQDDHAFITPSEPVVEGTSVDSAAPAGTKPAAATSTSAPAKQDAKKEIEVGLS